MQPSHSVLQAFLLLRQLIFSFIGCMRPDLLATFAGMQRQQRQEPPIEHNLPCSLEELYKGSTRKMKISRTVHNAAGRPERISEILSIDIKPGWKKGTRITFPEKGMSLPAVWTSASFSPLQQFNCQQPVIEGAAVRLCLVQQCLQSSLCNAWL